MKAGQAISKTLAVIVAAIVIVVALLSVSVIPTMISSPCPIYVQGYELVLTVVKDKTMMPIAGATVKITSLNYCGDSTGSIFSTSTTQLGNFVTPSNGTILIPSPPVANYIFNVDASGQSYTFSQAVAPLNTTVVTLSVPSGTVNVSQVRGS